MADTLKSWNDQALEITNYFITRNRESAKEFLDGNDGRYEIDQEIWPVVDTDLRFVSIDSFVANKHELKNPLTSDHDWHEFGLWGGERAQKIGRMAKDKFAEYFKVNWEESDKIDIRLSPTYQKFFFNAKHLQEEKYKLDSIHSDILNDTRAYKKKLRKHTRSATWLALGGKKHFVLTNLKRHKWATLPVSIILMFLFARSRRHANALYERIARLVQQGKFGFGGSAKFAGMISEWGHGSDRYALYMGRSQFNPFRHIHLKDDRHMVTISSTRGGKGSESVIPNLLLWKGSTIVVDPKGTAVAVTARRRREMGQNVFVIDPFSIAEGEETAHFNPFEMLDLDAPDIREQIVAIAEAIVIRNQNAKEPHWDDSTVDLIAGVCADILSSGKYEHPTLPMIRDILAVLPEELIDLFNEMGVNPKLGELARDAGVRMLGGIDTNEIKSILSNTHKNTSFLSSKPIKEVLQKSDFSFSDMKDTPTTIYLVVPPDKLKSQNRFVRLFINMALNQMSRGGKAKVPCLFILDEILALDRLTEVSKAFTLMAGYNMVLWPFIQDLAAFEELYSPEVVSSMLGNTRAIQVFGLGDDRSKEMVSSYLGQRRLPKWFDDQQSIAPLRTPTEVEMDIATQTRRQYILRKGKPTMVIHRVPYYASAIIRRFSNINVFGLFRTGKFAGQYDPDPDFKK